MNSLSRDSSGSGSRELRNLVQQRHDDYAAMRGERFDSYDYDLMGFPADFMDVNRIY